MVVNVVVYGDSQFGRVDTQAVGLLWRSTCELTFVILLFRHSIGLNLLNAALFEPAFVLQI